MAKKLRFKVVLLTGILVFCVGLSCVEKVVLHRRWLIWPELIKEAGMEMVWDNELPIKETETLERLFILGNRIYALSNHNYMVSLNREKGDIVFSRPLARAGFPVLGLELYDNELISIIGNRLVEIDPEFGTEHGTQRLSVGATCPAARNSSCFYLGGADRRMHALRAVDKVQIFDVAAENDSMITSIVADEKFVVFATEAGNVISVAPDRPKRQWRFDATGGVAGAMAMDAGSLFFASEDTYVYKLDLLDGKLLWKYQTSAILEKGPLLTQGVVYQYVGEHGLTAIDKKDGTLLWQLADGADLLAESKGRAYVITKNSELVVMDNNTGRRVSSANFAGVSRYVANVFDSKIYIADESGRIACLRPIE